MLSWLARVIKGIVIALGFILPGISGGVLAAILGIYERMIVSAGEVGHSIIVAPQDLASFVKADFVDILEDIK